jgi:hypothetical protein
MDQDPEKGRVGSEDTEDVEYAEEAGYDRLAHFMADVPDLAIFRRFTRLSAESLLHYQAELIDEERLLNETQEADKKAGPTTHRSKHAFSSWKLRQGAVEVDDVDDEDRSEQWRTIVRIRELLKEYRELYDYCIRKPDVP